MKNVSDRALVLSYYLLPGAAELDGFQELGQLGAAQLAEVLSVGVVAGGH